MYLLVLAFTFVNCYLLMILLLHLLNLFTYYVQIPFLNQINKIFKLPYFFKISNENLFHKDNQVNYSEENINRDQDIKNVETEGLHTESKINVVETEGLHTESKINDVDTEDEELYTELKIIDVDTEDEELNTESKDEKIKKRKNNNIEDFIEIKKNKILIDESLD